MTILSANEVPLGLRGLAIFLIGIGGGGCTLPHSLVMWQLPWVKMPQAMESLPQICQTILLWT